MPQRWNDARPWLRLTILCCLLAAATGCEKPKIASEHWEVHYIQGRKVGYGQITTRPATESGPNLLQITAVTHLSVQRFGEPIDQEIRTTSIETPAGAVVRFTSEINSGPTPMRTTGKLVDGQMVIETTSMPSQKLPWSNDIGGFNGVEQSLGRVPLKPGERRKLKVLLPIMNQVGEVELAAKDFETTDVLGEAKKLLRIESVTKLPGGQRMEGLVWIDELGTLWKSRMDAMQQESFRTTSQVAKAATSGGPYDLLKGTLVKLDQPLPDPRHTTRVRYRVELAGKDPAAVFTSGASQQVKPLKGGAAEITVRAIRGGDNVPGAADEAPPTEADLAPNGFIQSDDTLVAELASQAAADTSDPWQTAVALEQFTHQAMKNVNFSQAFATAAEVARTREGDCTEHAVLLTALLRARKIPARVAIGLVYIEQPEPGFGYHMWTEAHIGGMWIPLDATLGQGGTAGDHLKLADSTLSGASAYSSFLPVAEVQGRLKVQVLEAH